jgi:hypothetical protein
LQRLLSKISAFFASLREYSTKRFDAAAHSRYNRNRLLSASGEARKGDNMEFFFNPTHNSVFFDAAHFPLQAGKLGYFFES